MNFTEGKGAWYVFMQGVKQCFMGVYEFYGGEGGMVCAPGLYRGLSNIVWGVWGACCKDQFSQVYYKD